MAVWCLTSVCSRLFFTLWSWSFPRQKLPQREKWARFSEWFYIHFSGGGKVNICKGNVENVDFTFQWIYYIFLIPGSSCHPGCKCLLWVMLIYSFKGVLAKAPLSRAVASVGYGPGTKKEWNAEQWLQEKVTLLLLWPGNRHQFVVQCVVLVIWPHYGTVWADGTCSLKLYLTAAPLTFTPHAVRQS